MRARKSVAVPSPSRAYTRGRARMPLPGESGGRGGIVGVQPRLVHANVLPTLEWRHTRPSSPPPHTHTSPAHQFQHPRTHTPRTHTATTTTAGTHPRPGWPWTGWRRPTAGCAAGTPGWWGPGLREGVATPPAGIRAWGSCGQGCAGGCVGGQPGVRALAARRGRAGQCVRLERAGVAAGGLRCW